jgi:hypothetical protein
MYSHKINVYKDIVMLGKVFKKDGINLVYGESGLGKTVSTVKALNEDNVVPILLDFDNNNSPQSNGCEYIHIDGNSVLQSKNITLPTGEVIIIDTWQTFTDAGGSIEFVKKLQSKNNTIVIVAHNKPLATRGDIPDMDNKIYNHLDSKLFLEYDKGSTVRSNPRPEGFNLHVLKLRGYDGSRIIKNWMR